MTWLAKLGLSISILFISIFGMLRLSPVSHITQTPTIVPIQPISSTTILTTAKVVSPPTTPGVPSEFSAYDMSGLPQCYRIDNSGVYLSVKGIHGNTQDVQVVGADPATFSVLTQSAPLPFSVCFGKDERSVFYFEKKLEGADPGTFEVLTQGAGATMDVAISKDSHNVYIDNKTIENNVAPNDPIKEVKPDTIILLNNNYIKTSLDIFYIGDIGNWKMPFVEGADPDTFYVLSEKYAQDINHVYYAGQVIDGADPSTFEIIKKYADGTTLRSQRDLETYLLDPSNVTQSLADKINLYGVKGYYPYSKDALHVYYVSGSIDDYNRNDSYPTAILEADPKSFVLLNDDYAKDVAQVYFDTQPIVGADPSTFTLVIGNNSFDARDKNHEYLSGQVIQ